MFGPHARLGVHASRNTPLLQLYGRDTRRQKNDHYVYYNATTIAMPKRSPTSTTPENSHPTMKGAQEVCESTDGFVLTYVDHV